MFKISRPLWNLVICIYTANRYNANDIGASINISTQFERNRPGNSTFHRSKSTALFPSVHFAGMLNMSSSSGKITPSVTPYSTILKV